MRKERSTHVLKIRAKRLRNCKINECFRGMKAFGYCIEKKEKGYCAQGQ